MVTLGDKPVGPWVEYILIFNDFLPKSPSLSVFISSLAFLVISVKFYVSYTKHEKKKKNNLVIVIYKILVRLQITI